MPISVSDEANGPNGINSHHHDGNGNHNSAAVIAKRSVDEWRPMRVVVMGSGISGITASIRLRQRIQKLDLQVYEKNADVGGTWFENRYPGCACDIPAHSYQATFAPNRSWSQFYVSAKEIHQYWKEVAEKYGCMEYIKFKHRVVAARWDEQKSKWDLEVQNIENGLTFSDSCDVFISSAGALNNWKWPAVPGLHTFKGKLLHSANWDETYDYKGQRVAVIGNGSSGIQVVPGMLPDVEHIDHYVRRGTWLSPTFGRELLDMRGESRDNVAFSPEEIEKFKTDNEAYHKLRKAVELDIQRMHPHTLKGTPEQISGQQFLTKEMKRRLARKPELIDKIVPTFSPGCRRLTPGPGYLEALTDDKVDVIFSGIAEVDAEGIRTLDGQHRPVDAIVCATGFDTTFQPRFPIVGRSGISLAEKWKEVPETYIAVTTDDFPNYFITLGPNSALGAGNLLVLIEKQVDYITWCIAKMQRDNVRSMAPRKEVVKQFSRYCEEYFKDTVFGEKCRSWYKAGRDEGRIVALWPGSSLHALKVFSNPRWEDFEYTYVDDNPFGWFGDGWTVNEREANIVLDYIEDDVVDFPPVKTVQ